MIINDLSKFGHIPSQANTSVADAMERCLIITEHEKSLKIAAQKLAAISVLFVKLMNEMKVFKC